MKYSPLNVTDNVNSNWSGDAVQTNDVLNPDNDPEIAESQVRLREIAKFNFTDAKPDFGEWTRAPGSDDWDKGGDQKSGPTWTRTVTYHTPGGDLTAKQTSDSGAFEKPSDNTAFDPKTAQFTSADKYWWKPGLAEKFTTTMGEKGELTNVMPVNTRMSFGDELGEAAGGFLSVAAFFFSAYQLGNALGGASSATGLSEYAGDASAVGATEGIPQTFDGNSVIDSVTEPPVSGDPNYSNEGNNYPEPEAPDYSNEGLNYPDPTTPIIDSVAPVEPVQYAQNTVTDTMTDVPTVDEPPVQGPENYSNEGNNYTQDPQGSPDNQLPGQQQPQAPAQQQAPQQQSNYKSDADPSSATDKGVKTGDDWWSKFKDTVKPATDFLGTRLGSALAVGAVSQVGNYLRERQNSKDKQESIDKQHEYENRNWTPDRIPRVRWEVYDRATGKSTKTGALATAKPALGIIEKGAR